LSTIILLCPNGIINNASRDDITKRRIGHPITQFFAYSKTLTFVKFHDSQAKPAGGYLVESRQVGHFAAVDFFIVAEQKSGKRDTG